MLLLDTHVLVWWAAGGDQLSEAARETIQRERAGAGEVVISAISAWEVAMLVEKDRLILSIDVGSWLERVAEVDGVLFQPVDVAIARKSASLPGAFHKDPADRMIVATARELGAPLVTADEKILNYPHVRTVW
jgi:PIN domain nuclease of toxin-antitoxin system